MQKLIENPQFWTWMRCTTLTVVVVVYVHFGYKNPPTTVDFAFWVNVIAGIWGVDAIKKKALEAVNKDKPPGDEVPFEPGQQRHEL